MHLPLSTFLCVQGCFCEALVPVHLSGVCFPLQFTVFVHAPAPVHAFSWHGKPVQSVVFYWPYACGSPVFVVALFCVRAYFLGPPLPSSLVFTVYIRELKEGWWQRQWWCQKAMIWLVGWGKLNRAAKAACTLVQWLLILLNLHQFNDCHLLVAIFYNQTIRKFNLTLFSFMLWATWGWSLRCL